MDKLLKVKKIMVHLLLESDAHAVIMLIVLISYVIFIFNHTSKIIIFILGVSVGFHINSFFSSMVVRFFQKRKRLLIRKIDKKAKEIKRKRKKIELMKK